MESKLGYFQLNMLKELSSRQFSLGFDRIIETYPKMWSKFLYVGSSRSRKFLSLTIQDKWPEALRFIKDDISEEESFIGGDLTLVGDLISMRMKLNFLFLRLNNAHLMLLSLMNQNCWRS